MSSKRKKSYILKVEQMPVEHNLNACKFGSSISLRNSYFGNCGQMTAMLCTFTNG